MKKLFVILITFILAFPIDAVEVLSETVINKENVVGVYQDTSGPKTKYYLVYYQAGKKQIASMAKSEVNRYFLVKELGIDYTVVIQQLKTKKRAVIRTQRDQNMSKVKRNINKDLEELNRELDELLADPQELKDDEGAFYCP